MFRLLIVEHLQKSFTPPASPQIVVFHEVVAEIAGVAAPKTDLVKTYLLHALYEAFGF
jgi:hypothetical protein